MLPFSALAGPCALAASVGSCQHRAGLAGAWTVAAVAGRRCDSERPLFPVFMLWLIALVVLVQALAQWPLEPLMRLCTAVLSLQWLPWLLALSGLWLLAGRPGDER
jgi:hypothetical protein